MTISLRYCSKEELRVALNGAKEREGQEEGEGKMCIVYLFLIIVTYCS